MYITDIQKWFFGYAIILQALNNIILLKQSKFNLPIKYDFYLKNIIRMLEVLQNFCHL